MGMDTMDMGMDTMDMGMDTMVMDVEIVTAINSCLGSTHIRLY
jgi:hypothetical protein